MDRFKAIVIGALVAPIFMFLLLLLIAGFTSFMAWGNYFNNLSNMLVDPIILRAGILFMILGGFAGNSFAD